MWTGKPRNQAPTCAVVNFSPAVVAIVITPCSNDGPRIASGIKRAGKVGASTPCSLSTPELI